MALSYFYTTFPNKYGKVGRFPNIQITNKFSLYIRKTFATFAERNVAKFLLWMLKSLLISVEKFGQFKIVHNGAKKEGSFEHSQKAENKYATQLIHKKYANIQTIEFKK